jgi:hypothetical protein
LFSTPDGEWSLSIVDRKPGDVSPCVDADADWGIPTGLANPEFLDCAFFSVIGICTDGVVDTVLLEEVDLTFLLDTPFGESNLTFTENCCSCGGGIPSDELAETLFGWELVVYGRNLEDAPVESPVTDAPTVIMEPPVVEDCLTLGKINLQRAYQTDCHHLTDCPIICSLAISR